MADNECPICKETLHGSFSVGCTVPCGHVFHRKCFETWQIHSTAKKCPCCNIKLTSFLDKIHIHLPESTQSAPKTTTTTSSSTTNEHEHEQQDDHTSQSDTSDSLESRVSDADLKMKRRATLSMEKSSRTMRTRHKEASDFVEVIKTPTADIADSRNDMNTKQQPSPYRERKERASTSKAASYRKTIEQRQGEDEKDGTCCGNGQARDETITSLSRTLQRPSVVKHPYRYMQGKSSITATKTTSSQKSQEDFMDWGSINIKSNKDMMKSFEDQIPDLADRIMKDIEQSLGRSSLAQSKVDYDEEHRDRYSPMTTKRY